MTGEVPPPEPATVRPEAPVEQLSAAIDAREAHAVHRATDGLRERVEAAFEGKQLTPGSLVMERKRRLHERLDRLDDDAAAGDWARAAERAGDVPSLAEDVVERARALPEAADEAPAPSRWPPLLRNAGTVARKEAITLLQGAQGWILLGLLVLTFGIGLEAALGASGVTGGDASIQIVWSYANSLGFLAIPLAGILVGYGLVNEEIRSNTIHVLASKPVSRTGIALGKWLGMAAALAATVAVSAGIVALVTYGLTGTVGRPEAALGYPVACFLLALAFGTLALLASSTVQRTGPTLAATFGAYILLGPVWQNAFLAGSLESAGQVSAGRVLVYLASPFTAWWNWTSELLGPSNTATGLPTGEPWHAALVNAVETGTRESLPFYATQPFYVLVIVAWIGLTLGATIVVLGRRDLG